MEHNEENTHQQLFVKYLIASIHAQEQSEQPIDFSTKITEQSSLSIQNKHNQFTLSSSSSENLIQQFYKRIQQVQEHSSVPPKKRYRADTSSSSSSPDLNQTDTYSERRKKNNEAAKRSRDARRVKEDEIALRATWLEQENVKLRLENAHLKQENIQLHCQMYDSSKT